MILQSSTLRLLRFPFSFFLMPVSLFALSSVAWVSFPKVLLSFLLIHLLLYPSSNGYNSYMDRDTESIGGLEKPPAPSKQLFIISVIMDLIGISLSLFISPVYAGCYFFYVICSRLYSFRGVRLKQYPIIGYLTVVCNQGALIFFMNWHAATGSSDAPLVGMLAASFLIGGFYPMTQIYQHTQDKADQVKTLSILLGIKGTFYFCIFINVISMPLLFFFFNQQNRLPAFIVMLLCMIPVLFYFHRWLKEVQGNESAADFSHTMRMNMLASVCTNTAFIIILLFSL